MLSKQIHGNMKQYISQQESQVVWYNWNTGRYVWRRNRKWNLERQEGTYYNGLTGDTKALEILS